MESSDQNNPEKETESCQKGMSRKEFMQALVKKSVAAGVLLTALSTLETFDMPKAYAATATPP